MSGELSVVSTPIGNLGDLTARASEALKSCNAVIAEDTRRASQLLAHLGVRKPLVSFHEHNEEQRLPEILSRLRGGERMALVTDAGAPGISDPGERVVKAAIGAGFRVEAVPGPCALVGALTASGLPSDEFHFIGFLAHKSGQRRSRLEALKAIPGTLIFYESPYRVVKLLEELAEIFPDRPVVLARELTKKFEEYLRGTASELLVRLQNRAIRGEFVVLVGPVVSQTPKEPSDGTPDPLCHCL